LKFKGKYRKEELIDYSFGIAVDFSGNVYVIGFSDNGTNHDYRSIKYDSSGSIVWQKTWNGGGTDDGSGIAVDSSGNVYVTGFSDNGATYDYLTIKYDSSGDTGWVKVYDGGYNDKGMGIAVDSSGYVYVTGQSSYDGDFPSWHYLTIKYNSNGDTVWQKGYNGGIGDIAEGIAVDSSCNVYVTGWSHNGTTYDYLTIKYNSNGDAVWQKVYDTGGGDYSYGIAVDVLGNIYVTGYSWSNAEDYLTIKYRPHRGFGDISGKVTILTGSPVVGIKVQALQSGVEIASTYTGTDGSYSILIPSGTYNIKASWTGSLFISSANQSVLAGSANIDFTLSVSYQLGTLSGQVQGLKPNVMQNCSIATREVRKALEANKEIAFVELKIGNEAICRVPVDINGNYAIPHLLPDRYIARAYNGYIYSEPQIVNLKEGQILTLNFTFQSMPEDSVYVYPNPTTTGQITIRYYLSYSNPEVEIKIYNIAGELVKTIPDNEINKSTPPIYKYNWNCQNDNNQKVASGTYIFTVSARDKTTGENVKVSKKLVVIR